MHNYSRRNANARFIYGHGDNAAAACGSATAAINLAQRYFWLLSYDNVISFLLRQLVLPTPH